jgi:hypothetical protein
MSFLDDAGLGSNSTSVNARALYHKGMSKFGSWAAGEKRVIPTNARRAASLVGKVLPTHVAMYNVKAGVGKVVQRVSSWKDRPWIQDRVRAAKQAAAKLAAKHSLLHYVNELAVDRVSEPYQKFAIQAGKRAVKNLLVNETLEPGDQIKKLGEWKRRVEDAMRVYFNKYRKRVRREGSGKGARYVVSRARSDEIAQKAHAVMSPRGRPSREEMVFGGFSDNTDSTADSLRILETKAATVSSPRGGQPIYIAGQDFTNLFAALD